MNKREKKYGSKEKYKYYSGVASLLKKEINFSGTFFKNEDHGYKSLSRKQKKYMRASSYVEGVDNVKHWNKNKFEGNHIRNDSPYTQLAIQRKLGRKKGPLFFIHKRAIDNAIRDSGLNKKDIKEIKTIDWDRVKKV